MKTIVFSNVIIESVYSKEEEWNRIEGVARITEEEEIIETEDDQTRLIE